MHVSIYHTSCQYISYKHISSIILRHITRYHTSRQHTSYMMSEYSLCQHVSYIMSACIIHNISCQQISYINFLIMLASIPIGYPSSKAEDYRPNFESLFVTQSHPLLGKRLPKQLRNVRVGPLLRCSSK